MLDHERNDALMRVGEDTPMGKLLRRYWHPIAAASEFNDKHTKRVRLLGEDLVLYKDLSGTYGLLDRHCPHRRADLSYGFVEACGLRCNYHGWLFDKDGSCLAQPYEDTEDPSGRLRKTVTVRSYQVQELAGLLWAYLGPAPVPLVPNWEPYHWKNGFVQIVFAEVPCNWFQCQENSIDPVHFEWMHSNWSVRLNGQTGPYGPRHLKLVFEEFKYGFTYNVMNQDFIAWIGQGTMADRTREHLGKSDKGVAMIRRRFFEDMKRIERGQDPKAVIRDPQENLRVQLPIVGLDIFRNGYSSQEAIGGGDEERRPSRRFLSLSGQPAEVRRAYENAMGFQIDDGE